MPRILPVAAAVLLALLVLPAVAEAADDARPSKAEQQIGERASGDGERAPRPAGSGDEPADPDVVSTDVGEEGVKVYEFGAVEVEGRLRSPQIIYFLRRVRAQFDASGLGHRSFLRELSDTRRHPAFK